MYLNPESIWEAVLPRLKQYYAQTMSVDQVAEFVGAKPGTVMDWIGKEQPATGERLIKLWYFLRAVGFSSPELDQLDEYNRYTGELYAFGVLDIDEVLKAINVRNVQGGYSFLRGRPAQSPTFLVDDLRLSHDDHLRHMKAKLLPASDATGVRHLHASPASDTAVQSVPRLVTELTASDFVHDTVPVGESDGMPVDLASRISEAIMVLRMLDSEMSSEALRDNVKMLIGLDGLSELVGLAGALIGSKKSSSRS